MVCAGGGAVFTHLAMEQRVSASTQNQAFSALLFLFHQAWLQQLGDLSKGVRAKDGRKLPVVLLLEVRRRRGAAGVRFGGTGAGAAPGTGWGAVPLPPEPSWWRTGIVKRFQRIVATHLPPGASSQAMFVPSRWDFGRF